MKPANAHLGWNSVGIVTERCAPADVIAEHPCVSEDSTNTRIAEGGGSADRVRWLRPFRVAAVDGWVRGDGAGETRERSSKGAR